MGSSRFLDAYPHLWRPSSFCDSPTASTKPSSHFGPRLLAHNDRPAQFQQCPWKEGANSLVQHFNFEETENMHLLPCASSNAPQHSRFFSLPTSANKMTRPEIGSLRRALSYVEDIAGGPSASWNPTPRVHNFSPLEDFLHGLFPSNFEDGNSCRDWQP